MASKLMSVLLLTWQAGAGGKVGEEGESGWVEAGWGEVLLIGVIEPSGIWHSTIGPLVILKVE